MKSQFYTVQNPLQRAKKVKKPILYCTKSNIGAGPRVLCEEISYVRNEIAELDIFIVDSYIP